MGNDSKSSILVVDDEHSNIVALTHILRPDYTVYAEKTGRGAIETAVEVLPDLILLDILMPDMDGYAVLDELKNDERTCDIPVVFITALGDIESEKKGFSAGAVDYVAKPFIPIIVKLRVANQINHIKRTRLLIEKELEDKSALTKLEFLMRMSHEMMTPMNSILGKTQVAKKAKTMDERRNHLGEIETASRKLFKMLRSLFDIIDDIRDL